MPKPPNEYPLTEAEMVTIESERASKPVTALTPAAANAAKLIRGVLSEIPSKISLSDNEFSIIVKKTLDYLKTCDDQRSRPTMIGLARVLGHTRDSLYKHVERNPHGEVSRWLLMVKDAFAEILEEEGMSKQNPAMSMFLLKCQHDYLDKPEITLKLQQLESPFGEPETVAQIEARIKEYLPEGYED